MCALPEIEFSVVAAIDFGTARSGYGYAFTATPDEIQCPTDWAGGRGIDLKTLTNILINRETEQYTHFGYEAREQYYDVIDEDEGKQTNLFFETFKMSLYAEDGVQDHLTSTCGTRIQSHVVFREALTFMKDEVLGKINQGESSNNEAKLLARDVMWVITVPGMWRDQAKAIMRKAAEGAGMGTHHNLILALEPEAAAIHVRSEYKEMQQLPAGSKYIVVDCGGGTADFACHEVTGSGVRETHPAVGGPWGSTYIDKRFLELLYDILSEDRIVEFRKSKPAGWLSLLDGWEGAKLRMNDFDSTKRVPLPYTLIQFLGGEKEIRARCKVFSISEKAHDLGMTIKFSEGLKIDGNTIKYLFSPMLEGISDQIRTLLSTKDVANSTHLFVVGGFAQSQILQNHLKTNFPHMTAVIPNRPGLSVIQGAVRFGLNPAVVEARKARFTYGMHVWGPFEEGIHPPSKKIKHHGKTKCDDIFYIFVKKGQNIGYNEVVSECFFPPHKKDRHVDELFYASEKRNPTFVTDAGCEKIGAITIPLPKNHNCKGVECEMIFGGTEIHVISTVESEKHDIFLDFHTE